MPGRSRDIEGWLIWPLLPTESQWLLLKVCAGGCVKALPQGQGSADGVRSAWGQWVGRMVNTRRAILADRWGIKAMLPLLSAALGRARVGTDKELQTVLRAACLREQLRLATIRRLFAELLDALARASIEPLLVGELAVTETAYRFDPALRHCANIHLLVQPGEMDAAVQSLAGVNWRCVEPPIAGEPSEARLIHVSGLPLVVGSGLGLSFAAGRSTESLRAGSVQQTIGSRAVRQLGPADLLLSVVAGGLRRGCWTSIQWVCDAWLLARAGMSPADWAMFVSAARNARAARLVGATMKQIAECLPAGEGETVVPTSVLADLASGPVDPAERALAANWSTEAMGPHLRAALSAAVGGAEWRDTLRITTAWHYRRLRERLRLWAVKHPPIHRLARGVLRMVRLARGREFGHICQLQSTLERDADAGDSTY